ncbi:LysR substrate-binding domain-containing protein [Myceligenerans xiligouense]|uniref:LysR substrate binding domain-containing protein n=1 Tax=Myceligenerans xiligouense TaxID=253184 RepID=A0A3N4ZJD9_9MICO|nr:LysR substrate-binding domain-containing protein [Myceligenerans xiligouense]RPF20041.1 LysR substrate binding domain-containing protein [Myceligenerans xiligouense]
MPETFRLAYVPGATPGKWARVWRDRLPDVALELVQVDAADALAALRDGRADIAIARLPVDTDVFSRIPLYEEAAVVCVHREHLLAALEPEEAVAPADLAEETVWLPQDDVLYQGPGDQVPEAARTAAAAVPGREPVDPDGVPLERPATAADALAVVGAAAGITVLPMSLARLHHRKDVVYRPLDGGPTAPVGLVWPIDRTTDLVEEMIGIVRGRTVNSSRGRGRSRSSGDADAARAGASASARDRGAARGGRRGDRSSSGNARGHGRGTARGRKSGSSPNRSSRNRRRKED